MQRTPGRYIDPPTDWSFKHLFGNEPNKEILIEFLNDLFTGEKIITDLTYSPNEHNGGKSGIKKAMFDLQCTGDKGEKFVVEMQRGRQDFFRERAVFYTSRLISEQLPAGEESFAYNISEVYLVAVLEFPLQEEYPEQYFHNICLMDRETGEIFYRKLGYKFLVLCNFDKKGEELESDLDKWMYMLKNMSRLDQIPVYLNKRVFQQIFKIAEIANLTREEQMSYEASLKDKWDYENVLNTALREEREKSYKEGEQQGEQKGMLKIARKMKSKGYPAEVIKEVTDLSAEEIERL